MTIENTVVKFDYTKEAINKIVEETKEVDRSDMERVKECHSILVKVRTTITNQGKAFRDEANAFNKSVLVKQKEYLALTADAEEDLKQIMEDEKKRVIMEARKELLPMKKEQLSLLQDLKAGHITDEEILLMDDEEWVRFYQNAMAENTREKLEKEQRAEYEANREEREAEIAEKARLDGIAEQKAKEKSKADKIKAQEAKEKQDALDEKERMAKNKKYNAFLAKNDFSKETDIIRDEGGVLKIYRLVGQFKK